jgi:hypothetical protein
MIDHAAGGVWERCLKYSINGKGEFMSPGDIPRPTDKKIGRDENPAEGISPVESRNDCQRICCPLFCTVSIAKTTSMAIVVPTRNQFAICLLSLVYKIPWEK